MKKRKLNTLLKLNKEVISKLNLTEINGGGVPTEYNNKSQQLTLIDGPGEVCWNLGTRGLCTDELATC